MESQHTELRFPMMQQLVGLSLLTIDNVHIHSAADFIVSVYGTAIGCAKIELMEPSQLRQARIYVR